MKKCLIPAVILVCSGCAAPQQSLPPHIDPGNSPSEVGEIPINYIATVEADLKSTLKDPFSVVIEVDVPTLDSCQTGDHLFRRFHGWKVPVHYNAKNSFGAYVGYKTLFYWFAAGKLQRITENESNCRL